MQTFQVKVKPNARESALTLQDDGTWKASIKAPPVDGKANAELIQLISKKFHCSKSAITIKSGAGARLKLIHISNV
ncbi:DUF167 domain-containing protein [Luteolibacter pohnpeiensis]|uniref:UPF0235 protein JIN85_00650 n=1 Tax=Luteolibacter pohnpeiensis TaxID=454153 RepID=A0A934S7Q3_9BACT|nr:DUF167 domain-containing protein [Luteolibacter pohnpeiensis]MBK1880899.1 DUF167 domain-containing protein [Luteolibacter pohnpeiensis]